MTVPIAYYLVLSAILFSIGRLRLPDQAQHYYRVHVD